MAAGTYQLIWVAQGSSGITLASLPQTGATVGQAIVWNGSAWAPGTISGGGGGTGTLNSLSGDVTTGTVDASGNAVATVAHYGGAVALSQLQAAGAASNQYMGYSGTTWQPLLSASTSNTGNTLVARDFSGNFSAGTITASLNGNATTASFATSATNANNLVGNITLSQIGQGSATTGQVLAWSGTAWAPSAATSANTASALVVRDSSGNFSAGTITAALNGTASSATSYTGAVSLSQLAQGGATSSQVLTWNGAAWAPAAASGGGGGITALTGDVTASGSGSVPATVTGVGGSTASQINYAATTVSSASASANASVLAFRDSSGALMATTGISTLSSSTVTTTAQQSGITFYASAGSSTVTLIANPANIGYKYRFLTMGGNVTINPPSSGTFQYLANTTTSAIANVNSSNGNYIELTGIPNSSTYIVSSVQGNWQSAGSPIGVYAALSYPSTSGYVLTANGSTGQASFQPLSPGAAAYLNLANKTAAYTVVAADAGKWFTITGASGQIPFTLPAVSAVTLGYTVYFLNSIAAATATIKIIPNSADRIYMETGTTTASTGYISSSTNRTQTQSIGLTAVSANYWAPTYGYSFDWGIS